MSGARSSDFAQYEEIKNLPGDRAFRAVVFQVYDIGEEYKDRFKRYCVSQISADEDGR